MTALRDQAPFSRCEVLGIECFAGTADVAAQAIVDRALSGEGGYCCFCNVHVLTVAQRSPLLRKSLRDAWGVFPDGAPVAWLQRRNGAAAERVAGPDVMPDVLALGRPVALRHFLFGSTPRALDLLQRRIAVGSPGVKVVGALSPPFTPVRPDEERRTLAAIAASSPHVVWCALGAPKQELWMYQYARELSPALVIGVGAAFDFLAGTRKRAPRWLQQHSLEWLYRLVSEPRRLHGRYFRTNSEFVLRASLEILRRQGSQSTP